MIFAALLLVGLAASVSAKVVFNEASQETQVVPNEWIVVLNAEQMSAEAHTEFAAQLKGKKSAIGSRFAAVFVNGVSKDALESQLSTMDESMVKYVEANGVVTATKACTTQTSNVSWGQGRTTGGESVPETLEYEHDAAWGQGTVSYIIDTGIQIEHEDFGGRAKWGTNTVDNSDSDGNGHGTHVASTVGGNDWGLAKATELIAVKVLSASGSGSFQSVIGGIEWSANESKGKKATGNMSLGGGKSQALNDAADAAVDEGLLLVVAAGNSNADAARYSPASAPNVICVGSTDLGNAGGNQVDIRSYFSNYGSTVDVMAPGSDITAAWIGSSNTATRTISGTSMASPHVCGVANILMSQGDLSRDQFEAYLKGHSHSDVIDLSCSNSACESTPNLLLHADCE